MPDGVYPIVEATLYLATAPKSNSANDYFKAVNKVEAEGKVQVPKHLQDGTPSAGDARDLDHGEGYVYPHAEPGHHMGQRFEYPTRSHNPALACPPAVPARCR